MKKRMCVAFGGVLGWCLVLLACTAVSPGISPDPSQIHYPVGIAVHPTGRFLYVANSNFDLAYTGGSVMVFDTREDPSNIKVVDVGGVQTKLLTLKLLDKSTVEVGNFAGQLVVNQAGNRAFLALRQDQIAGSLRACKVEKDCEVQEGEAAQECVRSFCRLVQTIYAPSVVTFKLDVNKNDRHLQCANKQLPKEDTGGVGVEGGVAFPPAARCGDESKIFLRENPFPFGLKLVQECLGLRHCKADSDCVCGAAEKSKGLCDVDQRCDENRRCASGCRLDKDCKGGERCEKGFCRKGRFCDDARVCASWERCQETRLLVSHLNQGGLSEIQLPTEGWENKSAKERDGLRQVRGISSLPEAVTSIELLTSGELLGKAGEVFLSSLQSKEILVLPPSVTFLDKSEVFSVPFTHAANASNSFTDLRSMALGRDLKNRRVRLYVALRRANTTQSISSVLVYDLKRPGPEEELEVVQIGTIPVGAEPAHLIYRPRPVGQADLLYVVCSKEGRVDVINTESMQVIHQLKVGQQPYFMTIYEPKSATAKVKHRRAYVANFLDTSISIIDLDRHRVIGLIRGINTTLKTAP